MSHSRCVSSPCPECDMENRQAQIEKKQRDKYLSEKESQYSKTCDHMGIPTLSRARIYKD